ncbi:hypothetical protein BCY86_00470 [Pajaroellobacter abortibovis]|uniref:DNA 3'-5' helicase n=2 Tax=Pajaroellobacter abortibovis TaxID=1882918 RepID=A0A1L6MV02_9BACT|nr:hypothetical protein BCY86_00470 [Pajaroellobacter abortibovis]
MVVEQKSLNRWADPELNPPQSLAVAHGEGPLLVFAGAGSGKTRVITCRIASLVRERGVLPSRLLAVTFTNKAAHEMKVRLAHMLGQESIDTLWVGTFHAMCARLLRLHGSEIGIDPHFVIYDASDQKAIVSRILKELDLDEKRYAPRTLLSRIAHEKQEGLLPDVMQAHSYFDEVVYRVYERYQESLQSACALDFEDLIFQCEALFRSLHANGSLNLFQRFEYVLVDEFQDTNRMQYQLVRVLTQPHRNLCVVGDDDQSIYRWRGANVGNILEFQRDYPEAVVIKLEQNYRSTKRIVEAALSIISSACIREPKKLWTANEHGDPIEVIATRDERDEAASVIQLIEQLQMQGVSLRDMAIFYRVHAQSRVLEEALRGAQLPYRIVGGVKFYERAEVKDALSYLRVLIRPESDVDLLRIINVPARGIGNTTIHRLLESARSQGRSLFETLFYFEGSPLLRGSAKKKLAEFRTLLTHLRADIQSKLPSEVLKEVLQTTGYQRALRLESSIESDARLENLGELIGSMLDFEAAAQTSGETATLEKYLEQVTLQSDVDADMDTPRVTLMTVHSAKGLEFEVVFLTGMEEEIFPYQGVHSQNEEELDEERRLAYVAVTRARRKLFALYAAVRHIFGSTRWGRPSRFLDDLPQEHVVHSWSSALTQNTYHQASRHPEKEPTKEAFYVDRTFSQEEEREGEFRFKRGCSVFHPRFGEGQVRRVQQGREPVVVAYFPGCGEKKILARFLELST